MSISLADTASSSVDPNPPETLPQKAPELWTMSLSAMVAKVTCLLFTHGPIGVTPPARRTPPSARPDRLAEPIVRNELVENE